MTTDAPPANDTAEANVDNKPASVLGVVGTCDANILSAGPCHLSKLANLKIIATITPAIIGPLSISKGLSNLIKYDYLLK